MDDNSTDGSEQLCDQYAQAHPRVRVIHLTEHRGVSVARNTGVKNARGDLISFIDSDDFVSEEYLAQMVATLTAYQADVVFTGSTNKRAYSILTWYQRLRGKSMN